MAKKNDPVAVETVRRGGKKKGPEYKRLATTLPVRLAAEFTQFVKASGLQQNHAFAFAIQTFLETRKDIPSVTMLLDGLEVATSQQVSDFVLDSLGRDNVFVKPEFVKAAHDSIEFLSLYLFFLEVMAGRAPEGIFFTMQRSEHYLIVVRLVAALADISEPEAMKLLQDHHQVVSDQTGLSAKPV